MTIDFVYKLYEAIAETNMNLLFRTVDAQNILEGNKVAKNIYVSLHGDAMIKNGGFDTYLYEIRFGKISNAKVKQAFKEIGFQSGVTILEKAKQSADLDALDMEYYGLNPDLDTTLIVYVENEWTNPEFVEYLKSIGFKLNDQS